MIGDQSMSKFLVILATLTALLIGSAVSAGTPKPLPNLDDVKGDKCVAPKDVIRIEHKYYLLHQRDETMREGIRTKEHSLKNCINCHIVKGDDGKPVTIKDDRHFCKSCHTYASVQIDCFQCHASKPSPRPAAVEK